MSVTAIVTAFNDAEALKKLLPEILACPFDEIILGVGGNDGTANYVNSVEDARVRVLFEEDRMGKIFALKRGISLASGDITFVISGDTIMKSEDLWSLLSYLKDNVGTIIPKVVPGNVTSFSTRLGALLWDVRNCFLKVSMERGRKLHGGEVLVTRTSILKGLQDVINDDAFICLRSLEMGYNNLYVDRVKVINSVPVTIHGLVTQRERINLGHLELANLCMRPNVMGSALTKDISLFVTVLSRVVKERKSSLLLLPLVAFIEVISILLSRRDFRKKRNLLIWPIVD